MKPFTTLEGVAASLLQDNIDTDVIVRIERISRLVRGQFAPWAFEVLRYRSDGSENPDFVLNREPFRQAQILLAGANFGCGSSREMAVWSLDEFGIRCLIAPSFGDIFFGNCLPNGVLPITLARVQIEALSAATVGGAALKVDLQTRTIFTEATGSISFSLADTQRDALLSGLDEVDQTLIQTALIAQFQQQDRQRRPWVYVSRNAD
ncbi:MAG: 3-isopropylmalate/(R)-2-methylmalate dehydratase small subunit [Burkholderiaceae bacterium]|jgi:3-isopropylmalate/(R)-2-methylmalate dehydratase small subunit